MDKHLAKYPATVAGVKRGLKATRLSQSRAASLIRKSPAMVSLVLSRKAKSQPVLDALADLIAAGLPKSGSAA